MALDNETEEAVDETADPSLDATQEPTDTQMPVDEVSQPAALTSEGAPADSETEPLAQIPPQNSDTQYTPDDPRMIDSIIKQESAGNSNAVSSKGARGLMQIMPATFAENAEPGQDIHNSEDNKAVGTKYIKKMYDKYGSMDLALAAYNAGPGTVDNLLKEKKATSYGEIASSLPSETRKYVPKILANYEQKLSNNQDAQQVTGQYLASAKKTSEQNASVGTSKEFADSFLPVISDPGYNNLDFSQKIGALSDLYKQRKWDKATYELVKQGADNIWNSADPSELPNLEDFAGTPPFVKPNEDGAKVMEKWKAGVTQNLLQKGISPAIFGSALDSYMNQAAASELEAAENRNRGVFDSIGHSVMNIGGEIDKGIVSTFTTPLAGGLRLLGAESAANAVKSVPDKLLGQSSNDFLYETDKNGYLVQNQDGSPQPRYMATISQGVGQVGATIAGGALLKAAGFGLTAVSSAIGGANVLQVSGDTFEHVKAQTGDDAKAYKAALFALPAVAAQSLPELAIVSKFLSPAAKAMSKYEQIRYLASTFAKNAAIQGAGSAAGDVIQQGAEMSQTGQKFDADRTTTATVSGAVAGGLAAVALAPHQQTQFQKMETTARQAEAVSELRSFQEGLVPEKKTRSSFKDVPMDVADQHGINVTEGPKGEAILTKKQDIVTPEIKTPEELTPQLEALRKAITPKDIRVLADQRNALIAKAKTEGLSPKIAPPETAPVTESEPLREANADVVAKQEAYNKAYAQHMRDIDNPRIPYDTHKVAQDEILNLNEALKASVKARDSLVESIDQGPAQSAEKAPTPTEDVSRLDSYIEERTRRLDRERSRMKSQTEKGSTEEAALSQKRIEGHEKVIAELQTKRESLINKAPVEEATESYRRSNLTEAEEARLADLDSKLEVTDNDNHTNNIKAIEQSIAMHLQNHPESLPAQWDGNTNTWTNTTTGERAPFLKDVLFPEENAAPELDAKRTPSTTRLPIYPARKALGDNYTTATVFPRNGEQIVHAPQVERAIAKIGELINKESGGNLGIKRGGRGKAGTLGTYNNALRALRVNNANDIPTFIHEMSHHMDYSLGRLTDNPNPELQKAFRDQAKTFYPTDVKGPTQLREGLTMFLQNYTTGQPVNKTLLSWWNSEIKSKYPDIHAQYEVVKDLAHQYYNQSPENFAKQFTSGERITTTKKILKDLGSGYAWTKNWLDRGEIYRQISKDTKTDLYKQVQAVQHKAAAKTSELINTSISDFNGNRIEGVTPLTKIVAAIKGKEDILTNYVTAKRAAALHGRGIESGLPLEDAAAIIQSVERDHPDVVTAASKTYDWWNSVLDIAAERSPEFARYVEGVREANLGSTGQEHGFYIPFSREQTAIDASDGTQTPQGPVNPFMRMKGSTKRIENPIEQLETAATRVLGAAQKRFIYDQIVAMHDAGMSVGKYIQEIPKKNIPYYKGQVQDLVAELSNSANKEGLPFDVDAATKTGSAEDMQKLNNFLEAQVTLYGPELTPPKGAEGYTTIAYKNGNKTRFFELNPDLMDVFNNELPAMYQNPFIHTFFNGSKRLLQAGATTFSLPFQFANFVFRDPMTAILTGKSRNPLMALQLGADMVHALYDQALTKTGIKEETWTALANRLGVATSTRFGSEQSLRSAMKKNVLSKYIDPISTNFGHLEEFLGFGERATRTAAMRAKARELGIDNPEQTLTPQQAIELITAYQDSTANFGRQGKIARIANLHIPFFSARLAELTTTRDAFTRDPVRTAAIGLGFIGLGIANVLNHRDDDWFKNTEPSQRANSYMTSVKDSKGFEHVVAVPLGSYGGLMLGLGQAMASALFEDGDLAPSLLENLSGIAQNQSPIPGIADPKSIFGAVDVLPYPMKVALEQIMNKKFYSHRAIVPDALLRAPAGEQKTEYTSKLAEALADTMGAAFGKSSGVASPMRVEDVMRSFLPGPMKAENWLEQQFGIKPLQHSDTKDVPALLSPLVRNGFTSTLTNRSQNKFYEKLTEAEAGKNSETNDEAILRKKLTKVASLVSDISKVMRTETDPDRRAELSQQRADLFKIGVAANIENAKEPMPNRNELQKSHMEAEKLRKKKKPTSR